MERPRTAEDTAGHTDLSEDENWICVGAIRGDVKARGGRESRVFDQVQAETSHVIDARADPLTLRITPKWRLREGRRKLNITAVNNLEERGRVVRIEAIEAK